MAIHAGIDMSMVPSDTLFPVLLAELVHEGRIDESRLDESVRRILSVKYDRGLFDTGGMPPSIEDYPEKASLEGAAARAPWKASPSSRMRGSMPSTPTSPSCRSARRAAFWSRAPQPTA